MREGLWLVTADYGAGPSSLSPRVQSVAAQAPGQAHAQGQAPGQARPGARRSRFLPAALLALAAMVFLMLAGWQMQRRTWKLGLIAAVDARATAQAEPAPGPAAWSGLTAQHDAYRHVSINGTFLNDRETLVQAATELGAGFWVMAPLRTGAGWIVLVNRGFVPDDRADPATRPTGQSAGPATVTGLLRITEPGGSLLQGNDPATGRWYSRDVAAIARARGLTGAAPYFIDADATPNPGGLPVGGLTVIRFANNHLVYALTWLTLAGLSLAGAVRMLRIGRPERTI